MDMFFLDSHHKIGIDCDLSECAVEEAMKLLKDRVCAQAVMLVAPMSSAFIAGKMCQKYGLQFIGVPDELMKRDSWMICGNYSAVYSAGA